MSAPTTQRVTLLDGTVPVAYTDEGTGSQSYLLLHGGAGPMSMRGLASALLSLGHRVVLPTHPGFAGEPHPPRVSSVADLAALYLALLAHLRLSDVVVLGNSMGGWLAAEMALQDARPLRAAVLMNASGVDTEGTDLKLTDPTSLPPAERGPYAFHNPGKFAIAPTTPEGVAAMQANGKALRVYCGEKLVDPALKGRLGEIKTPVLVLWGTSDRIVTEEYGRRLAGFIPNARFEPIADAGHFPQIEQLQAVTALVTDFAGKAGQGAQS